MKQWEIWTWQFPGGSHPAVIVSNQHRIDHQDLVNVLYCSSQRAARRPYANEVLLDSADGLNWETICRCDLLYLVEKSSLAMHRGTVVSERQVQIAQRIVASFAWKLF